MGHSINITQCCWCAQISVSGILQPSICLPAIHCILLCIPSLGGETCKHKGCFLGCFWGRNKLLYEPDKSEVVALFGTGSGLTNSAIRRCLLSVLRLHGSLFRVGYPPDNLQIRTGRKSRHLPAKFHIDVSMHGR